ncbi:hypothetical protein H6763_00440 [Candidatus Nomurabacteria bacterium]|nr:hypothetical protein [Candidatus Nomurabacteria bacterium]MCB9803281.1 hypothetical protein [Candidatus Nomurabacteria bacterium]
MQTPENQNDLRTVAQSIGIKFVTQTSILPGSGYEKTEFVFMSAMANEDLYVNEPPTQMQSSMALVRCIRRGKNQQLQQSSSIWCDAGESTRHLKTFDMLGFWGKMDSFDAISKVNSMLHALLPNTCNIVARVHPKDVASQDSLKTLNMPFTLDDKCHFDKPEKTNRAGYRVEFVADAEIEGVPINWELQNLTIISQAGDQLLDPPMAQSGGSVERVVAIRENKLDVFQTSLFPIDEIASINNLKPENENDRRVFKLADLARTIITTAYSGVFPKSKGSVQERLVTNLYNTFLQVCMGLGVTPSEMRNILKILNEHQSEGNLVNEVRVDDLLFQDIVNKLNNRIESVSHANNFKTQILSAAGHTISESITTLAEQVSTSSFVEGAPGIFINQDPIIDLERISKLGLDWQIAGLLSKQPNAKINYKVIGINNERQFILPFKDETEAIKIGADSAQELSEAPGQVLDYCYDEEMNSLTITVLQVVADRPEEKLVLISEPASLRFDSDKRYDVDNSVKRALKTFQRKVMAENK